MSINGYKFSDLSQEQLDEIKRIEKSINEKTGKDIILLAFNKE